MIIEALMNVIYTLFEVLTSPISIPSLPEGIHGVIDVALDYIAVGLSLLINYTDLGYLLTLFGLVIAVDAGLLLYKLVMWIIRKIPMLGIE